MLSTVTPWRHAVAGFSIALVAGLAGFGVIGAGDRAVLRSEHFDAKQVTVSPIGADGVRIREVVDIDFGVTERHGYERIVPHDFGIPTDVAASSPDANDTINQFDRSNDTRIRLGSRSITYTGQRRYVLEYTLPDAQLASGRLALDIIGADDTFVTDRFEVVLTGFELENVTCDTGDRGTFGGCELTRSGNGDYVAIIEPLDPLHAITVGGDITSQSSLAFADVPPLPPRNPSGFRSLGFAALAAGALATAGVFLVSRRLGSNRVMSGGAADAAFGTLPTPRQGDPIADVPTYRVPDSRLAELATIEFVPPRGVEPWQAAVLLSEDIDDDSVSAWFSEMIARDAIIVYDDHGDDRIRPGGGDVRLSAVDQRLLGTLFASAPSIELGKYNASFSSTWKAIRKEQRRFIADSGWWAHGAPGAAFDLRSIGQLAIPLIFVVIISGSALLSVGKNFVDALTTAVMAVVFSALLVGVIAFAVYRTMLPSRSVTGSALTLRSESFRRFLVASEGRHVQWAWDNGVLREYSAWAVALGAADAWSEAVKSSNIPEPDDALRGPLLLHSSSSSFRSSRTPPSSSGGSGGFSGGGGGAGSGGGGGSSGSW